MEIAAFSGGRQRRVLKEDGELVLYTISTVEDHTVISRIILFVCHEFKFDKILEKNN